MFLEEIGECLLISTNKSLYVISFCRFHLKCKCRKDMLEPSFIEAPWATGGDSERAGGSFLDSLEQECIRSIMLIMGMVIFRGYWVEVKETQEGTMKKVEQFKMGIIMGPHWLFIISSRVYRFITYPAVCRLWNYFNSSRQCFSYRQPGQWSFSRVWWGT